MYSLNRMAVSQTLLVLLLAAATHSGVVLHVNVENIQVGKGSVVV